MSAVTAPEGAWPTLPGSLATVLRPVWTATCPCGAIRAAAMEADTSSPAATAARRHIADGRPGHTIERLAPGAPFALTDHQPDCRAPRPTKPAQR